MDIKYINICMDREQLIEFIYTTMKNSIKEQKVPNNKIIKQCLLFAIGMLTCNIGLLIGASEDMREGYIFNIVLWSMTLAFDIVAMAINSRCIKTANNINNLRKQYDEFREFARDNLSYDNLVNNIALKDLSPECGLLWVVFNTHILEVTCTKYSIDVIYEYQGVVASYILNKFDTKGLEEFNTVSITKDGVFLGMYDNILNHAYKSIVIGEGFVENET